MEYTQNIHSILQAKYPEYYNENDPQFTITEFGRPTKTIETEFRFTEYSLDYNKHIRRETFYRVLEEYRKEYPHDISFRTITDESMPFIQNNINYGNLRHSTISYPTSNNVEEEWLHKYPIPITDQGSRIDNKDYYYRIAMNLETLFPGEFEGFLPQTIRIKKRTTVVLSRDPLIKLDLTEVDMSVNPQDRDYTGTSKDARSRQVKGTSYEIELEFDRFDHISFELASKHIHNVLRKIQNSMVIYPYSLYTSIVKHVNDSLFIPSITTAYTGNSFDTRSLFNARNLHFKDMVYGGLVGNPNTTYSVTVKTDGIRKLLVFYRNEIWLVFTPGEASRIITDLPTDEYHGYIFEGEMIPKDKRAKVSDPSSPNPIFKSGVPTNDYWFLIFDTLSIPTKRNLEVGQTSIIPGLRRTMRTQASVKYPKGDWRVQNYPHRDRITESANPEELINRIQKGEAISRLDYAMAIVNDSDLYPYIKDNESPIHINTKTFYSLVTPEQFFRTMNDLENQKDAGTLPYDEDGYIFMPDKMKYTEWHSIRNLDLYKRVLTKVPDICKWKSGEDMTIDLEVVWVKTSPTETGVILKGGKRVLKKYAQDKIKRSRKRGGYKPVPADYYTTYTNFTGTRKFPFHGLVDLDKLFELNPTQSSGLITEFRWDAEREILVPTRIRKDKTKPNQLIFANDTWDMSHDPIPIETMKGQDSRLMRKYHNRIKRRIYQEDYTLSKKTPQYLLDLGSGRGGDINSWKNFSKVVSVEPNSDNIRELVSRLGYSPQIISRYDNPSDIMLKIDMAMGSSDRVIIVQTVAQDYDLITRVVQGFIQTSVTMCTFMLSMSFLWENMDILDGVVSTIVNNLSVNGEIRFFTIDGDLVSELFEPTFNGTALSNPAKLGPYTLSYNSEDRSLDIDMPGTIVGIQHEWLVRLDDLRTRLQPYGLEMSKIYRADQEGFLPLHSQIWSSLYSYGMFTPIKEDVDSFLPLISLQPEQKRLTLDISSPLLQSLESQEKSQTLFQKEEYLDNLISRIEEVRSATVQPLNWVAPNPVEESATMDVVLGKSSALKEHTQIIGRRQRRRRVVQETIQPLTETGTSMRSIIPSEEVSHTIEESNKVIAIDGTIIPYPPPPPDDNSFIKFGERIDSVSLMVQLPPIIVTYNPYTDWGDGDDTPDNVKVSWYTQYPVTRIACIGDGSCFFHSVLKGYYPQYSQNKSYQARINLASYIRQNLANLLAIEDTNAQPRPDGSRPIIWETSSGGRFKEFNDEGITMDGGRGYSLEDLQSLLRSQEFIGSELFRFVAERMQVNIHVLLATRDGLYPFESSGNDFDNNIFVSGLGNHYELIGVVKTNGKTEKLFSNTDPFVIAYNTFVLYRKIYSGLQGLYSKYQSLLNKKVTNTDPYHGLTELINQAKIIYDDATKHMANASQGDTSLDYVQIMTNYNDQMIQLLDRGISIARPYLD